MEENTKNRGFLEMSEANARNPAPSTRFELFADIAQLVERDHGKIEVSGSIPDVGSRKLFNTSQDSYGKRCKSDCGP